MVCAWLGAARSGSWGREEHEMQNRPLARAAVVVAAVTALFSGITAQTALADQGEFHAPTPPAAAPRVVVARFEGRQLTLRLGWGGARVCVVDQANTVTCYRTEDDAAAATAAADTTRSYNCSYPLRLYDDINYGGRQLWFYSRGFWQNVGDYGFDNQASSFITGDCYAHLAEYPWGAGYWYPGYTGPWGATSWVGDSWNDRISSIFLE